ncbi:MAG: hypothetical protein ACE5LL_00355 [Alphaproteobacteria bacterium]
MKDEFSLLPLRGERITQAFPLIREVAGDITLERWQAYVAALTYAAGQAEAATGALAVQSPEGTIRGLASYRVALDLLHGRVLVVEQFVVSSRLYRRPVATQLLEGLDELARKLDCAAIHATFPRKFRWLIDFFRRSHYGSGRCYMCKRLAATTRKGWGGTTPRLVRG